MWEQMAILIASDPVVQSNQALLDACNQVAGYGWVMIEVALLLAAGFSAEGLAGGAAKNWWIKDPI